MNAIIIEDEQIAAQNLKRLLVETAPEIQVSDILQSVEESVEYFNHIQKTPDVVFMDIHLADGLAFHIFDQATVDCPVIFTTAYDQYALDAFKVNSIDYLLKPINQNDLARAIQKLRLLTNDGAARRPAPISPETIATLMEMTHQHRYKSHFLIPVRDKLIPLPVKNIAYIYLDDKISRAVTFDNQTHIIDKPLDNIFAQLNPNHFFSANREYIIADSAIGDISVWPLGKLHVSLTVATPEKIIIPRARTSEFKDWYTN